MLGNGFELAQVSELSKLAKSASRFVVVVVVVVVVPLGIIRVPLGDNGLISI